MQESKEALIIKIDINKKLIENMIKKPIDTNKDLKFINESISRSKLILSNL